MLWILIGYMFLFIHRPFEVWPMLGDLHLERLYALGAMLAVLFYSDKRWIPNKLHIANALFATVVLFCWIASPWAEKGQQVVEDYFKILIFYVLFMAVVQDEKQLRTLLLAFLAIMFIYMLHSLREYVGGRHTFRMGIARMVGVDKSLGDPNSFGASIVYALPLVGPFWLCGASKTMKAFLLAYVGLSLVCIGLTGSRSSFVGLILWCVLTVMHSRRRWSLALGAMVLAPVLWFALPESLQTRFETIIHPEVGPANAVVSGQGRIEGFQIGFELLGQNPVSGVGPGAWRPATKRLIESHNLYGQIAGELGGLGLLSFSAIVVCFYINIRHIRKAYRNHSEWNRDFLYYVSGALGLALVLLLFEGNFGHNLFRFTWVWYGGFLILARHCLDQKLNGATVQAGNLVESMPSHSFGWGLYRYG